MDENKLTPQKIVELLGLEPLAFEGGFFRRFYYAPEKIPVEALGPRYPRQERRWGSGIYYFLTSDPDSFSAMHRLPTDEIFHFYLGDPVETLQLYPDGSSRHVILGSDILAGQQVQTVVPQGVWQGSYLKPGGTFALLGCTMAPAFEDTDFEEGKREDLSRLYPNEIPTINRLTRTQ